ncbi:Non-repetitive/WGA-negative nucleoporin C-terminal-domain-containing protein [Fennellomyces sp. T-0311]|nr:Non-repetitive/WGA-negative nucleoporin C-terminal-domain-containing protein [Fennellomyces sp. T-0311]
MITAAKTTDASADYASLMNSGKTIEQLIERDSKYPDLADLLRGPTSEQYAKRVSTGEQDFVKDTTRVIPQEISELIDVLQCRCFMGILPEIKRAWVTIDHRFCMWNYMDGTDVVWYDDQDQIICSVGLVKPRPGVFGDHIKYLLVLTTRIAVSMLAVSITSGSTGTGTDNEKVTLIATDIAVSSDEVVMNQAVGTDEGRVFLVGDGQLFELEYLRHGRWWGHSSALMLRSGSSYTGYIPTFFRRGPDERIKSVALDNERKVLYLLTTRSTIEVIYLGPKADGFTSVARHTNVCDSAQLMCRQSSVMFEPNDFEIQSIHVISKAESKKVHLLGVTTTGFRLYFTHHKDAMRTGAYMPVNNAEAAPNALELVHVRLPPAVEMSGPSPMLQGQQNHFGIVHAAYYDCGTLLAAKSLGSDKTDVILMTAMDLGDYSNRQTSSNNSAPTSLPTYASAQTSTSLVETSTTIECDGNVWAIAEANPQNRGKRTINEVTEILSDPPRQFLVLTENGLSFYKKQRPVDILQQLLIKSHGDIQSHQQEFVSFFERYGRVQSCAMCLAIICANFGHTTPELVPVIRAAALLFFEFGGNPTAAAAPAVGGNYLGKPVGANGTTFSGKHDGFALYFARLVAPVWKLEVFAKSTERRNEERSKFQVMLWKSQRDLSWLQSFMDLNPKFHMSASIADSRFQSSDQGILQVLVNEQQSIHALYLLLKQCIEAISFLDFLLDTSVQEILQCVPEATRNEMQSLTLEAMLATPRGRVLTRELVIATIDKYGASHTHVGYDIVSDLLRRKCSSFFGPNDVAFYRGVENLKRAQKAEAEYERTQALAESLSLFKDAAEYLTDEKLAEICNEYNRQRFHMGSVELPLERAKKIDPQQQGLAYMEAKAPPGDPREPLYEGRVRCYHLVFAALASVKQLSESSGQSEPKVYAAQVFAAAVAHKDKLFHFALYQWFLEKNMKSELLSVDTPYLIPFFKEYVSEVEGMDFLWQYYRRREQYYEAAVYLDALACRQNGLTLSKRVELLALAMINAQCRDPKQSRLQQSTQLLQNLEHKMSVARIQVRLQQALQSLGPQGEEGAKNLEGQLLDITELFNKYARHYGILDEILFIMKVSEYHDIPYLEEVWRAVIAQNEKEAAEVHASPFTRLKTRVTFLGERLYPSPSAFPVDLIVEILEHYCFEHRGQVPTGYIVEALRAAGVPAEDLLNVYTVSIESKRPIWHSPEECEYMQQQLQYLKQLLG